MVKHYIIWTLKEMPETEKEKVRREAKENLEALVGVIPGLTEMKIGILPLSTSSGDMMMDSTFDSFESLKAYRVNPAHTAVADRFVRPFISARSAFDCEI